MENLKINRDKSDLTDDQILKHKNFNAVLQSASVSLPWYKMGKFWLLGGGAAIVLIVTTILVVNFSQEKKSEENLTQENLLPTEISLTENKDKGIEEKEFIAMDKIKIVPGSKLFITQGGGELEFPEQVYKIVGGNDESLEEYNVNIIYYTPPVDLHYSEHSKKECFEITYGPSDSPVQFYGADYISVSTQKDLVVIQETEDGWMPVEPLVIESQGTFDTIYTLPIPQKPIGKPFAFDASYQPKERLSSIPELAKFDQVVFEPIENIDVSWYEIAWDDFAIEHGEGDDYIISLMKGDVVKKCSVRPVFTDENFDKAFNVYLNNYELKNNGIGEPEKKYSLQMETKYVVLYP